MIERCDLEVLAVPDWIPPKRLNNPGGGFVLTGYSGLGVSDVKRLSVRGAQQQGFTDVGYRQNGRTITLEWALVGSGKRPLWGVEDMRTELYGLFRPRINDPVPLRFITPGGRVRQADVDLIGVFDSTSKDNIGYASQPVRATRVWPAGGG